ncbi:MAG: hypothetical protein KME43_21400 [Myxacorys chilensis ATA2-1-KO14]|nr:hypothetical protein [Myxacorys chilensis ATA2-1-KO14]
MTSEEVEFMVVDDNDCVIDRQGRERVEEATGLHGFQEGLLLWSEHGDWGGTCAQDSQIAAV